MATSRWIAQFLLDIVRPTDAAMAPTSHVSVTPHDGGVTIDFPLPEDPRVKGRQRAWRAFEIGIVLLLGSIFWFAVCVNMEWPGAMGLCVPVFVLGIGLLISAANMSSRVWRDAFIDDACCQLAVVGNMLIRTTRDHRKQIWYRHEIHELMVEAAIATDTDGPAGKTIHVLTVHVQGGDKVRLTPAAEPADLEMIAAVLRQVLDPDTPTSATPIDEAIQADKTRIAK